MIQTTTTHLRALLSALALGVASIGTANAVSIGYEGTIAPGVPVTGSVSGDGWLTETAAGVDFWRFSGIAGYTLGLQATRLNAGLDPVLTLYFGTTTADASLFIHDADWGGLVYLALADDETAVPSGPGGDPALTGYVLPYTGNYTIAIGGFNSTAAGPYSYSMQLSAVPEPATLALWAAGLGGMAWVGRRRQRARSGRADA